MLTVGDDATIQATDTSVAVLLSEVVRGLRTAAGLTVTDVARTSGVSRRMLTLIEAGEANPSVLILDRVAAALETTVAELLLPTARPNSGSVVRAAPSREPREAVAFTASQAVRMLKLSNGGVAHLRSHAPDGDGPELWTWFLAPGDRLDVAATERSADLLFLVTTGRLDLRAGSQLLELSAGDSAWVSTATAHTYSNPGPAPCEFTQVTHAAAS